MSHLKESEIIKYRLQELKKLSYDLKQFTDTHNQPNYEILKEIIRLSKSNSSEKLQNNFTNKKSEHFKPLSTIHQQEDIPPLFDTHKKSQSKVSGKVASNYENEFHQKNTYSPNNGSPQSQKKSRTQLEQLRNENLQLQLSLQNLKKELEYFRSLNERDQQNKWKQGIPYFKMNSQVGTYITLVAISSNEYSKIAYKPYYVQLDIDKLSFRKGNKIKQKQYSLTDLKQVFYHENQFMVLHFKQGSKDQETVFLKFADEQNRHRWDLGIYINFKIINSLGKSKQFSNEVQQLQIDTEKNKQQLKQMLSSGILSYSNDEKQEQLPIKYKKQSETIQKIQTYQSQKQKIDKARQQLLMANVINELDKKNSDEQHEEQSDDKNLFSHFGQDIKSFSKKQKKEQQEKNSPFLGKKQQSKFKGSEDDQSDKNQEFGSPSKINNKVPSQSSNSRINSAWRDKMDQLLQVKQQLSKGCALTKYAQGGWSPHKKFIYLNKDGQTLTFRDEQKDSDLKIIKIKDIISIKPGQIGKGIKKFIPQKNLDPENYVVLQLKKKVIELGSQQKERIKRFTQQLSYLHQQLTAPPQNFTNQAETPTSKQKK